MSMPLDCPLIEVSGTPLERGRQYGEQAVDRVRKGVGHYSEQIQRNGLSQMDLEAITDKFAGSIATFGQHYIDEMKGIAEGAGISFTDVMLLNARTEVLKMAHRRQKGAGDFIDPDGCTGVLVLPSASNDGKLIHAQNWDWKAECAETAVVLKIRRDDGPDIITFTEAGGLARTGFNSAGISISGNYLESDRDYRTLGVPLSVIRRNMLEQRQLALAMQSVYATAKSASNNIIMGHVHGFGLNFECAPNESFLVHPTDGLIVHANHFQSPVALAKLKDCGIANMPDSLYRDTRVHELLRDKVGSITVEHVKKALWDDFESPFAVCRPPRKSMSNNLTATVAMIVMQPATGTLQVSILPALNTSFFDYSLTMDVQAINQDGRHQVEAA
ncbi:C45 family autoproteolytic acyltransferase/hydolase [Ensifer sp. 4252]|uniref:C45 family autoproteolytic acyltransferase/hydolase n=1 Tax=Ensifer sp. 4252 TaxID=3373915 RepID=UPI003D1EE4AA